MKAPLAWDDLRVLLVLARTRSLAAAARALDVDATTVSRRVASLEAALEARLVVKNRGDVRMTQAALEVIAEAEQAEQAIERAVAKAGQHHRDVRGLVRVAVSEALAVHLVAPTLAPFLALHPELQLELDVGYALKEVGRDVDVALRVSPPRGEMLRVRRAGEVAFAFYLAAGQSPTSTTPLLLFPANVEDRGEAALRRRFAASRRVLVLTSSSLTLQAAAAAGAGIAMMPCICGDADPRLRKVASLPTVERPLWTAVHKDSASTERVRVVAKWLRDLCLKRASELRGTPSHGSTTTARAKPQSRS